MVLLVVVVEGRKLGGSVVVAEEDPGLGVEATYWAHPEGMLGSEDRVALIP